MKVVWWRPPIFPHGEHVCQCTRRDRTPRQWKDKQQVSSLANAGIGTNCAFPSNTLKSSRKIYPTDINFYQPYKKNVCIPAFNRKVVMFFFLSKNFQKSISNFWMPMTDLDIKEILLHPKETDSFPDAPCILPKLVFQEPLFRGEKVSFREDIWHYDVQYTNVQRLTLYFGCAPSLKRGFFHNDFTSLELPLGSRPNIINHDIKRESASWLNFYIVLMRLATTTRLNPPPGTEDKGLLVCK